MPVEIRELHIRVTVQSDAGKQPPARQGQPGNAAPIGQADKDVLIAECVEQVLEIMQSKKER
jgi:hypothetical protein